MNRVETTWKQYYHYSKMREGLLSWYEFCPQARILEWNGEKGALTGLLAERSKEVICRVASELQEKEVNRRYAENTNIHVVCRKDNLKGEKFDYIIAVNPFEKFDSNEVILNTLAQWKEMLSHSGILLLVCDNLLSINRWIGVKNASGREFDKWYLRNNLSMFFSKLKFYYVFPDFVFPQAIYTDENKPGFAMVDRILPYAANIEEIYTDETQIYRTVAEHGDLTVNANSFMVECTNGEELCEVLSAMVTTEREQCGIVTKLKKDTVEKQPLDSQAKHQIQQLYENIEELKKRGIKVVKTDYWNSGVIMPFVKAPMLSDYLKQLVSTDTKKFIAYLDVLYQNIIQSSEQSDSKENVLLKKYGENHWGPILKNNFIEMTPLNAFEFEGEPLYFDQEFVFHNYPAAYTMYRCLAHLYYMDSRYEQYVPLEKLKQRYGLCKIWNYLELEEQNFLYRLRGEDRNADYYQRFTLANKWRHFDFPQLSFSKMKYMFADIQGEEIVCFGAGGMFEEFIRTYGRMAHIAFVVDNNKCLWGTEKCGVEIKAPIVLQNGRYRVIITCREYDSVFHQLEEMDVKEVRIFTLED